MALSDTSIRNTKPAEKAYKLYDSGGLFIQITPNGGKWWRLSGSICYDATDMKLTADLRDISDAYLISALNNDITTLIT